MHSMGVQAVLTVVLILFTATVKTQEGEISVWKTKVTLTCPESGDWYENEKKIKTTEDGEEINEDTGEKYFEFKLKGKTTYHCQYPPGTNTHTKYYFRVEGKVCENCYELDGMLVLLVIVVDVVGTVLVMLIICYCTKNKSSPAPAKSSKAPARPGGRSPAGASSEYQELNRQTRSQETYSVVNRTG